MRTVCSWCKAVIHDGPTDAEGRVSHGMCPDCETRVRAEAGLPPRAPFPAFCPRGHRKAGTDECRSLRSVAADRFEYVWGDCGEVERACSGGGTPRRSR